MTHPVGSGAVGFLLFALGCSGSGEKEMPPPPPPPPDLVGEPPVTPPVVAPVADLLPPPWGELGLQYGACTVQRVGPGVVILTAPESTAATTTEPLYATWEQKLTAAGYRAGTPYTKAPDSGEPWTKGEQRLSIARGTVDGVAYLYAEDLAKVAESAVANEGVDAVVHQALGGEAAAPSGVKGKEGSGHTMGAGARRLSPPPDLKRGKKAGGKKKKEG